MRISGLSAGTKWIFLLPPLPSLSLFSFLIHAPIIPLSIFCEGFCPWLFSDLIRSLFISFNIMKRGTQPNRRKKKEIKSQNPEKKERKKKNFKSAYWTRSTSQDVGVMVEEREKEKGWEREKRRENEGGGEVMTSDRTIERSFYHENVLVRQLKAPFTTSVRVFAVWGRKKNLNPLKIVGCL